MCKINITYNVEQCSAATGATAENSSRNCMSRLPSQICGALVNTAVVTPAVLKCFFLTVHSFRRGYENHGGTYRMSDPCHKGRNFAVILPKYNSFSRRLFLEQLRRYSMGRTRLLIAICKLWLSIGDRCLRKSPYHCSSDIKANVSGGPSVRVAPDNARSSASCQITIKIATRVKWDNRKTMKSCFSECFNVILARSGVPLELLTSRTLFLSKKKMSVTLADFRPISIGCCLALHVSTH